MDNYVEMWRFETARFTVIWDVKPSDDVDISWDETGETAENLNSGLWTAFDSRMRVMLDGVEIAADYLGSSIYENPSEFRDHVGMNAKGHGSYFSDMVRSAVSEARQALAAAKPTPRLRAVA